MVKGVVLFFVFAWLSVSLAMAQSSPNNLIPELMRQINVWRLREGLGPLVYNPTLEAMAASQADYLLTLGSIPRGGDIHIGARGEDIRQRSQFEPFLWPTYGHPQKISVTEIAAIGNIRTAINFWSNSDIHRRSVTNPNYREVGVAARQYGTDVMFIVVLGGRPNVLPSLVDADSNLLYLTNERNTWTGDWIGVATRYRILDSQRQVVQDWASWARDVPIPTLDGDIFYVEYEDAAGKRTATEVRRTPIWSSIPIVPTATPTPLSTSTPIPTASHTPAPGVAGFFTTNTPVPSPTPIPTFTPIPSLTPTTTPSPTIPPDSVALVVYPRVLTLISRSDFADVSDLVFRGAGQTFAATRWETVTSGLNTGALARGHCLQVVLRGSGQPIAPDECRYVRSLITLGEDDVFWSADFEVLRGDVVVATCPADTEQCEIVLPK